MKNDIKQLIENYAHDYRDMKFTQEEMALLLTVFGDDLKDIIYKNSKKDSYTGNDLANEILGVK